MRFDRRRNYPLYDPNDISNTGILTDVIANATIIPKRVGGVIKTVGPGIKDGGLPLNRAVVALTHPYLYKIVANVNKMTHGGTSPFFGHRPN